MRKSKRGQNSIIITPCSVHMLYIYNVHSNPPPPSPLKKYPKNQKKKNYRLDEMFSHRGLLLTVVTFFFDFFVICSDPLKEFQTPAELPSPPAPTWQTVINTGCIYNSVSLAHELFSLEKLRTMHRIEPPLAGKTGER